MTNKELQKLISEAMSRYNALSPAEKEAHNYEQRRSFVRGMCPDDRDYHEWCQVVDKIIPPLDMSVLDAVAEILEDRVCMVGEDAAEFIADLDRRGFKIVPK